MTTQTDIAILGTGPGGYVAALRAAQLGAQVTVVEEGELGGVCLNVGCIPTKALLRSAEVYRTLQHAEAFGLQLEGQVKPNWTAIQARKERIVQQLVGGVGVLLRKAGVQAFRGRGWFATPSVLEVMTADGVQRIEAQHVVIATGSRPVQLSLPGMDLPGVIDSTAALAFEELPRRLLIIGGGVIGVEFAEIFGAFGVQVTIVEMLSSLLPLMDADLGQSLARTMGQRGVQVLLDSRLTRIDTADNGLRATVTTLGGQLILETDRVLIAVGRQPNSERIGLDLVGVHTEKTGIPVDAQMRTNVPAVFAVGDVTGSMQLAHVASEGGKVAVETALGHTSSLALKTVPNCVYTNPEIASVGLTEKQAREAGHDVQVGRFPLHASGKALTYGEINGFVKIVSEKRFGEVLGLHIVAPHASDLIHEGGLALFLEATMDELAATVHGHPTLGEAIHEAVLAAREGAIHLPR
jgi:dihydrolipoamide dehydrogenase